MGLPSLHELERSPKFQQSLLVGLRVALGIIFLWFGLLKIFGLSPVHDLVQASFPLFATKNGSIALGILEAAIGLGLLFRIRPRVVNITLFVHMLGTLSVFLIAPDIMFAPAFPGLTLTGEFVLKNIVIAMSGLVILFHEHR